MSHSQLCPRFEKAMGIISQRWTGIIIHQLLQVSPQRFKDLESSVSISGRVLSERLKDLEKAGIVKREVFPETPVRIEYSLTKKGQALYPVLNSVEKWAEEWFPAEENVHE